MADKNADDNSRAWGEGFNRGLGFMAAVAVVGLGSLWLGSRQQAKLDDNRTTVRYREMERLWPKLLSDSPPTRQGTVAAPDVELASFKSFARQFADGLRYVMESLDKSRAASVVVTAAGTAPSDAARGQAGPPVYEAVLTVRTMLYDTGVIAYAADFRCQFARRDGHWEPVRWTRRITFDRSAPAAATSGVETEFDNKALRQVARIVQHLPAD